MASRKAETTGTRVSQSSRRLSPVMSTVIKLVLVALIVNGAARVGLATARYYQLKDESQQLVTFAGTASPNEIHDKILAKATDLDLPISPEAITVRREGPRTFASAGYSQPVEVFPNYIYTMQFEFNVDAVSLTGLK